MNIFFSHLNQHRALILLNALYLATGLLWINLIPYNNAPDENTHFQYSVEFIIQHHRLPVWGVDDIERFRHALSSYNQMPALNYILYAAGGALVNKLFGLQIYIGARMVSIVWGFVFINFLFLAVRKLCGNYRNALIVSAAAAFIPQVLFSFCYVNADSHSLAIAAILGYALMRLLRRQSTGNIIFAGAAIGLLFSAKYNYYIYFPAIAVMLSWAVLRRTLSWKTIGRLIIAAAVLSLLISGCWFIRNFILYGNPLPILLSEDFFRSIGLAREVHPVNRGVNITAFLWLYKNGFFGTTFNSFFAVFGYLNVGFHGIVYIILQFIVPLVVLFFVLDLMMTKDRLASIMLAWLAALIAGVMAMHVWTCLTNDYQPQGRYQFTILVPIAIYAGWAITRQASLRKHAVFFLVLMLWLFIGANILLVRTYSAPVEFMVALTQAGDSAGATPALTPPEDALFRARRTGKNFYATEKIELAGGRMNACLRVGLPEKFLARFRDFKLELETDSGVITNDWTVTPPEGLVNTTFNKQLNAFEVCGYDSSFILPLRNIAGQVKNVKIGCRIENRRLYDMGE